MNGQSRGYATRTFGLPGLNQHLSTTSRLVVLSLLEIVGEAVFTDVEVWTGLSRGNLTGYVRALEEANLLEQERGFVGRKPKTNLRITQNGREALRRHRRALSRLPDALARRIDEHRDDADGGGCR